MCVPMHSISSRVAIVTFKTRDPGYFPSLVLLHKKSILLAPFEIYTWRERSHPAGMQKWLVGSRQHSLLKSSQNGYRTWWTMIHFSKEFPSWWTWPFFYQEKQKLPLLLSCLSLHFALPGGSSQYSPLSCTLEVQLKSFLPKLNEKYRIMKNLSSPLHYQVTFWKALKVIMNTPGFLIRLVPGLDRTSC